MRDRRRRCLGTAPNTRISPLICVRLEKPSNLSASTLLVDEDRVVAHSIWSPDHGIIVSQSVELLRDSPGTGARGCLAAKAWNWVVFQNKSVFRKSFRSINQGGLPNPTTSTIKRVVSLLTPSGNGDDQRSH
jgi:hypothetical protein